MCYVLDQTFKMLNLFKGHFIKYFQYFRYRKDEKGHHSEIDPFELQICIIQGTRNGIDRCLELIREKFPLQQYQVCLFHLLKMLSRFRKKFKEPANKTAFAKAIYFLIGADIGTN